MKKATAFIVSLVMGLSLSVSTFAATASPSSVKPTPSTPVVKTGSVAPKKVEVTPTKSTKPTATKQVITPTKKTVAPKNTTKTPNKDKSLNCKSGEVSVSGYTYKTKDGKTVNVAPYCRKK